MAVKIALVGLMLTPYLITAAYVVYRKATDALTAVLREDGWS